MRSGLIGEKQVGSFPSWFNKEATNVTIMMSIIVMVMNAAGIGKAAKKKRPTQGLSNDEHICQQN